MGSCKNAKQVPQSGSNEPHSDAYRAARVLTRRWGFGGCQKSMLAGSWVVRSRGYKWGTMVVTLLGVLKTLLIRTHEPPSKVTSCPWNESRAQLVGSFLFWLSALSSLQSCVGPLASSSESLPNIFFPILGGRGWGGGGVWILRSELRADC